MTIPRLLLGVFLILIGLSALTGVALTKFFFSFLLIVIGIRIIAGKRSFSGNDYTVTSHENTLNDVGIFTVVKRKYTTDSFSGGNAVLLFSGGTIDLSGVKTADKKVELEIVAIFGGAKIIVPKNWNIASEGVGIFGGFNNQSESNDSKVTLLVKGAAIFGEVNIVNK